MSWGRIDDTFHRHPKIVGLSLAAVGLHMLALSYCGDNTTDGEIPAGWTRKQGSETADAIQELEAEGLWKSGGRGWWIHDYLDYNPSRAQVEAKREAARQRMKKVRDSRGSSEVRANKSGSSPNPVPKPSPKDPDIEPPVKNEKLSVEDESPNGDSGAQAPDSSSKEFDFLRWHATLWGATSVSDSRWGVKQRQAATWLLANVDHAVLVAVLTWAKGQRYWASRGAEIKNVRHEWIGLKAEYDAKGQNGRASGVDARIADLEQKKQAARAQEQAASV